MSRFVSEFISPSAKLSTPFVETRQRERGAISQSDMRGRGIAAFKDATTAATSRGCSGCSERAGRDTPWLLVNCETETAAATMNNI